MLRRFDASETQATLHVNRNMKRASSVSADALVIEQDERNPTIAMLWQFKAFGQLPPDEEAIVNKVLDSLDI